MGLALLPAKVIGQVREVQPVITETLDDIIVIGRRQPRVDPKDVRDKIPPSTIKAYAADNIGELLDRLSARFQRGLSILVNGRRLASLDAINALPPEALQQIELLSSSAGDRYGFESGSAVLNLALRSRFRSTSLNIDVTGTTEGRGDTESGAVRYGHIRGDNRLNLALTYDRQSGLLESDRLTSTADRLAPTLHSLTPHQDLLTFTSGYATPLGGLNLDLSAEMGAIRSDTLTGPITNDVGTINSSRQQSDTRYVRSSATVSGSLGRFFWSALVNGEQSRTSVSSIRGRSVMNPAGDLDRLTLLAALPGRTRTIIHSAGVTTTLNGPLLSLPAGQVTFDASFDARASSLTSIATQTSPNQATSPYNTVSAHSGANVPIVRRGAGLLGWLGDLNLHESIDYLSLKGVGNATGLSSALEWSPAANLLMSVSFNTVPSLPSASQRFAPIVYQTGVLVYDATTGQIAPVTVLTGGRDDVRESHSTDLIVMTSYQASTAFANLSGSLSYTIGRINSPLISFNTPSPMAQALLPNLFVRDTSGVLRQFDARPFNGLNETTRQISTGVHLNGRGAKSSYTSAYGGAPIGARAPTNPMLWDVNLSYAYTLSHRLRLALPSADLDLLTTPLSLAGSGTARHRIGIQWTLATPSYGLNGSLTWNSGGFMRAFDRTAAATHYSTVTIINIESFYELGRSRDNSNPQSLRFKIGINNLFNRRLRVTGYPDLDGATAQYLADPYGRIFRFTLRKLL